MHKDPVQRGNLDIHRKESTGLLDAVATSEELYDAVYCSDSHYTV